VTPSEAVCIVAMLANAPDSRSSAAWTLETQQIFARLIEDLDYESTMAAALTWLKTQSTRPTIADLRATVRRQLEAAGAIPADPDPDQAWGIVTRAFSSVGRYRSFPSDNPLVKRVVDRIGWETLCASDNPEADRAHFLRMYAAELDRERDARHAATGLTLPYDQARLGTDERRALGAGDVPQPVTARQPVAMPAPLDNIDAAPPGPTDALEPVRAIKAAIQRTSGEVPKADHKAEVIQLREPTNEEHRAADERRRALRAQLERMGKTRRTAARDRRLAVLKQQAAAEHPPSVENAAAGAEVSAC